MTMHSPKKPTSPSSTPIPTDIFFHLRRVARGLPAGSGQRPVEHAHGMELLRHDSGVRQTQQPQAWMDLRFGRRRRVSFASGVSQAITVYVFRMKGTPRMMFPTSEFGWSMMESAACIIPKQVVELGIQLLSLEGGVGSRLYHRG